MRKFLTIVASVAILGWAGMVPAGLICDADAVTGTTGCELGSTNNDYLNPLQVNLSSMFDFKDWVFAHMYNGGSNQGGISNDQH